MTEPLWFDFNRPTVDVCICVRCGEVLRPITGGFPDAVFQHCGDTWVLQGRYAKPLAGDFWDRFQYGDKVPKRLRQEPEDDPPDTPDLTEFEPFEETA